MSRRTIIPILLGLATVVALTRVKLARELGARHFTLYVLGGSTAHGVPYQGRADFGRIASYLLGGRIDGREVRVVNLAESGRPSRQVAQDAGEIGRGAGAVFLYCGNNEFLGHDTRHDLSRRDRKLFDEPTMSPDTKEQVLQQYRLNIRHIAERLVALKVPLIISSVAVNVKDWEPNRSVLRDGRNAPTVRQLLAQGDQAYQQGRVAEARTHYGAITDLEPTFALAWQKLADRRRRQGNTEQARQAYQMAIDHDGNPTRILSRQNRDLRAIAKELDLPFVDAIGILERAVEGHLLGYELMFDNCHPSLGGYALVSAGFAQALKLHLGLDATIRDIDLVALERSLGIDEQAKCSALVDRAQYCYRSSTLCWDRAPRLRMAHQYLEEAGKIDPDHPELLCAMAVRSALAGDGETALAYWRRAYFADRKHARKRMNDPRVRQVMRSVGIQDITASITRDAGPANTRRGPP